MVSTILSSGFLTNLNSISDIVTARKRVIATEDITKVKKFISQEIKLALDGITPEETRIMKNSNPERRCGFIACLEKIEELKNNYLKLN